MSVEFIVRLRGVTHSNADGRGRQALVSRCRPGDPLTLVPQPDNPHDRHAVAVFDRTGAQLGYLPSDARDSSSIQRGEPVTAEVVSVIGGQKLWHKLFGIDRSYGLLVRLKKGEIDWSAHNALRAKAIEVDELVKAAIAAEKQSKELEHVLDLYRKSLEAVTNLNATDKVAAAHRYQSAPINRLTMLLVKKGEPQSAVSEYDKWKRVSDPVGLTKGEQVAVEKRIARARLKQ